MASDDSEELDRWFKDLPFKLKREVAQEIKDQAEGLRDAISENAPEGETRKLKGSVRVSRGKNTLELIVEAGGPETTKEVRGGSGVPYDYAIGTEFGNERVPAQLFFYSTYFEKKEDIQQAIADRVENVLSRA